MRIYAVLLARHPLQILGYQVSLQGNSQDDRTSAHGHRVRHNSPVDDDSLQMQYSLQSRHATRTNHLSHTQHASNRKAFVDAGENIPDANCAIV